MSEELLPMTWEQANDYCKQNDGTLVRLPISSIVDGDVQAEIDWLKEKAQDNNQMFVYMDYQDKSSGILGQSSGPLSQRGEKTQFDNSDNLDATALKVSDYSKYFGALQPFELLLPQRCIALNGIFGWTLTDEACFLPMGQAFCRLPKKVLSCN